MVDGNAANIVPFGKYKGQPVEAMMADPAYCAWAMAQPGLRERFAGLFAVIVNGGVAPDAPTPEHNRMQLLFRNPDLRVAAYRSIVGEKALDEAIEQRFRRNSSVLEAGEVAKSAAVDEEIAKGTLTLKDWLQHKKSGYDYRLGHELRDAARDRVHAAGEDAEKRRRREMLDSGEGARLLNEAIRKAPVEFEVSGWDVALSGPCGPLTLEPIMGDDYPVVLRAMKMRREMGRRALIVDHFEAEGASLDDVKWLFAQSGMTVKPLAEIRAAMPE